LDELLGYEPQMTDEDIDKLYEELSNKFFEKPFDEVMDQCREIVKKYFSCFPLIYRMGLLYTNYGATSNDNNLKISALTEAKELFIRVKELSDDVQLKQLAIHIEATCEMMLGNPNGIIELLDDIKPPPPHQVLLSKAYLMKENVKDAKAELQELIFSNIMGIFEAMPIYTGICVNEAECFEEACKRAVGLIDMFNLKSIAPAMILPFYLSAAQGYLSSKNIEKSLDMLETYTDIVTSDMYPIKLVKGDNFFNLIDNRRENLTYGIKTLPRDEKSIRQSLADYVTENPEFASLSSDPRFKILVKKLKNNIKDTLCCCSSYESAIRG
jgi:hypothetical protein